MSKKKVETTKRAKAAKADSAKPAPADPPLIAKPPLRLERVKLDRLVPNPWNGDRTADADMVQSIRAKGVLQTLLVREVKGGKLQVVCGGRRYDGAVKAQCADVPVAVYELTDQEAQEVRIIENLQREDPTPIEEAKGVAALLKSGKTHKEVAAQLGRPWTWVVRRAKLASMAPEVFKALDTPKSGISHASIKALELLAKYPHDIQRQMLAGDGRHGWFWANGNYETALAEATHELKRAPWATEDALLVPKAGSCLACFKRSCKQPGLFDDTDDTAKLVAHDRCLDGGCWAAKLAAHLQRIEEKAKTEHPGLVKVATESAYDSPYQDDETVLHQNEFRAVKAGTAGAKPGLVVHGPDAGTIIHVVPYNSQTGRSTAAKKQKSKTMAEKRAGLASRRVALIIVQKLRPELDKSKGPKPGGDPLEAISDKFWLRLVAAFGCNDPATHENDWANGWPEFDKSKKFDPTELHEHVWAQLKPPLRTSLSFDLPSQLGEDCIANAKRLAWLLGLKWAELEQWAAQEIPEPKAWAAGAAEKKPRTDTDKHGPATKAAAAKI